MMQCLIINSPRHGQCLKALRVVSSFQLWTNATHTSFDTSEGRTINEEQASGDQESYKSRKEDAGFRYNQRDGLYKGHIQTSLLQKAMLATGSTVLCLASPWRDDMISVMGEVTGFPALKFMHGKMLEDEVGEQILREQPRINSSTVDIEALGKLPEDTMGYHYFTFLKQNGVHPDERRGVQFVDDAELAYVMTRYRETHDLLHTLLGMPTNMLGEVAVKWIEGIQFLLPLGLLGGPFGALRLRPKHWKLYREKHLWWAMRVGRDAKFLMNVYYENVWDCPITELRREFNIEEPPATPQLMKNRS